MIESTNLPVEQEHSKIIYDDHGRVLSGTLQGLVDRLFTVTNSAQIDKEFCECFLTVYRGFARTDDLLLLVIERYKARACLDIHGEERVGLRKIMATISTQWLEIQEVESKDERFLKEMEAFVNSASTDELVDKESWSGLHDAIRAQLYKIRQPTLSLPLTDSSQRIELSDLDETAIAQQLMLMESELFQKIRASDYATWVKNVADERSRNLSRFFKNNYKIADWCQSMILFISSNDIEGRANTIGFFGRVAAVCLQIRSFSTAHAIMAGLTTDFINGLEYTWRLVDKRTKESLKQLSLILSDEAKYKGLLDSDSGAPAVPILSIHLRDLRCYKEVETYIEVDRNMLVNFQTFEEVRRSIKAITKYKTLVPNIQRESVTAAYLEFELSKIGGGVDVQSRLKARSDRLRSKERRDYDLKRFGTAHVGFQPPKDKYSNRPLFKSPPLPESPPLLESPPVLGSPPVLESPPISPH
ncbi:hypothetical protein FRC12_021038 [Ceratobasidium sp. 428]|nr:hypothetical protein FRC12_021038 [Ceratobasidium sp. 428]